MKSHTRRHESSQRHDRRIRREKATLLLAEAIESVDFKAMTVTMISGVTHDLSYSNEAWSELLQHLGVDAVGRSPEPWVSVV